MKMKKMMAVGTGKPRPRGFPSSCGRVLCVHGSDGVHGPMLAGGGDANRREDGDGGLSPFQDGRIQPGATRAMGVTEERLLRRKTAGFVGVAPGITRGAIPVWLLLPARAISPARMALSDATALRPPCDSGRDSSPSYESRSGAA